MRRRRSICGALAVALCVAAAASLAQADEPLRGLVSRLSAAKPYTAAWASIDRSDEYWRGIAYGLVEETRVAGIDLAHIRLAGDLGRTDEQIAHLDEIGALKPDIVFLSPTAADGLDKAIERLVRAGAHVVLVGAPIRRGPIAVAVLQDQAKIGARMAQHICASDSRARVATIPGPAGFVWNKQRFDGFRDELAEACPDARLYGGLYQLEIGVPHGQLQTADLIIKYPQVNFIYIASGVLADGAANVRLRMRHPATIVTAGLTRSSAANIEGGHISVVVSEPAVLIGRLAVQYAIRAVEKKSLPGTTSAPYSYPTLFAPNVSLTRDLLKEYDFESYDLAPADWALTAG